MPGADQHFWVKKKKKKPTTTNFSSTSPTSPHPLGKKPKVCADDDGSAIFYFDEVRVLEKQKFLLIPWPNYFVFADFSLIQLKQLLIKKNRYSSLINAMLNYNTMMSAVLIKYWLSYKKIPRCSKSHHPRICANLFTLWFWRGEGEGAAPPGSWASSNISKH